MIEVDVQAPDLLVDVDELLRGDPPVEQGLQPALVAARIVERACGNRGRDGTGPGTRRNAVR